MYKCDFIGEAMKIKKLLLIVLSSSFTVLKDPLAKAINEINS